MLCWSSIQTFPEHFEHTSYVFGLPFLESKTVNYCFAINLTFVKHSTEKVQSFYDY